MKMLFVLFSFAVLGIHSAEACSKIVVKGMTCDNCRDKVVSALKSSDKVQDATVNLEENTATIVYKDATKELTEAELQALIKSKAGFKAQKCLEG